MLAAASGVGWGAGGNAAVFGGSVTTGAVVGGGAVVGSAVVGEPAPTPSSPQPPSSAAIDITMTASQRPTVPQAREGPLLGLDGDLAFLAHRDLELRLGPAPVALL